MVRVFTFTFLQVNQSNHESSTYFASMLALRRTFNQQVKLVSKFRSFSSEAANVDSSSETPAPKVKEKKEETKKKKNMEGVKSKQQVEIFQQFYDATEAALK